MLLSIQTITDFSLLKFFIIKQSGAAVLAFQNVDEGSQMGRADCGNYQQQRSTVLRHC